MPDTAPPGTTVGLVGTCYPIHSGRPGAIYFDDILMARVRGDTPGSYSAGVVVPADATIGTHEITLRAGEDDGPIVGRVAFDVLPFCRGDCDGDGRVTVAEVLLGINVALGRQSTGACPMADPDQDGTVSIDELIVAVEDLLSGCIVEFTPTPTPRDTPTPVALGGPCRDTGECQEARLLCLVPGRFAGCVECQALTSECVIDADCAGRGAGIVCAERPMLGRDCLCAPAARCVSACSGDDGCEDGQRCDASGHCTARTCASDDECPAQFTCFLYGDTQTCVRRYCQGRDADCPSGFCVDQRCHDRRGTCELRPGTSFE